jgi:CheY-like chemotaxis protein
MRVKADPTRLEQIITNLISNAAKYTDPGGRIEVSAYPEEDHHVIISVKDNGIGLTETMQTEVFQLFTQVEKTLDRARGGLGIGLAVVKKLVEMHGGTVEATSPGLNQGSEFTVRFPAVHEPGSSHDSEARPPTRPPARRILVVDDNVDTAIGMARLLRLEGHEVEIAHDGPAGLELAQSYLPQILILDIGLPGLNGYEVASTLREDERFHDSLFIAASGYGQEHDRERSRQAGFDHHSAKPIDLDALLELIAVPRK